MSEFSDAGGGDQPRVLWMPRIGYVPMYEVERPGTMRSAHIMMWLRVRVLRTLVLELLGCRVCLCGKVTGWWRWTR